MSRRRPSPRSFRKVEAGLSHSRDCICMWEHLKDSRLTSLLIPYTFNWAKLCFAVFLFFRFSSSGQAHFSFHLFSMEAVPAAKPQCGGGGANKDDYDLPLHVAALCE